MSAEDKATSSRLRSFVERIERLESEKAAISDDIKEVKREAKIFGFDVRTINEIIRLRKMEQNEREEYEALLDIYKASLGMLHDTPLGEAARRRLTPKKNDPAEDENPSDSDDQDNGDPVLDPLHNVTEEQARQMGKEASEAGKPVTDNPFPARDIRRAAWDEAWCAASGSDGMEIPEAWRRKKPEKPAKADDTPEEKDAA